MRILTHLLLAGFLFLSQTSFAQWDALGSGLSGSNIKVYGIDVVDVNTFWGVARDANWANAIDLVVRTTDGGATWTSGAIGAASGFTVVNVFAQDANTAWVVASRLPGRDAARIYKTTDGGSTWSEQNGPFNENGNNLKAVHFFDANRGVAFGSVGIAANGQGQLKIYETNDGGATWAENTSGVPALGASEGTYTDSGSGGYAAEGNSIWLGTTTGNILRSTDQGANWTSVATGFTGNFPNVSSIAFRDANNGIAVSESRQAAATTDGGATWNLISTFGANLIGFTPVQINYVPGTNNTYVICDGVFNLGDLAFTNDDGATWAKQPYSLSMEAISFQYNGLAYGGGTLSNSGVGGTYKWENPAPGLATNIAQPDLSGVSFYPNPLSDVLNITLEKGGSFSYQLIDLQGREILNGKAEGFATVGLPVLVPAVYVLKVQQRDRVLMQKVRVE